MRIAIIVVSVLIAVVLVVVVIGYTLPVAHRASRSATFPVAPDSLFAILTDVDRYPSWRPSVKKIERVASPSNNGGTRFREIGGNGAILYDIVDARPGERMVTKIADPKLPFGGTWTYELAPMNGGTSLRITEDGEVYNPVFRFMSRYVFSYTKTLDTYLADLAKAVSSRSS